MKKTKAAGNRRENQVKAILEAEGFTVTKARLSLGACDLVAVKDDEKLLVQVKANKGSPWMNFRKEERVELLHDAELSGGIPVLAHWPPHGKLEYYWEEDWPS